MWPFGPSAPPQQQPVNIDRNGTLPPTSGVPPPPTGGITGWIRDLIGGWAGTRFEKGRPAEQALLEEKVRAGPQGIVLPWFPPYSFDNVTGETGEHRLAYRRMFADAHVKPCLCAKILGVGALDLQILPASNSHQDGLAADFATYCLTDRLTGGIPELVWSILSGGLVDGYSICEKVFAANDSGEYSDKLILDRVRPINTGEDLILETDDHRNVVAFKGLRYNSGRTFDPRGFIHYRHMPLFGSPVGMSDCRAVYRPWWFLQVVSPLRAIACEKRAIPLLLGHYGPGVSVQKSLEAALAQARNQTWFSVPESARVEALNIAGSADEIFKSATHDWIQEISRGIEGAVLQSLEGQVSDARGSSKVHKSVADLYKWYLATQIEHIINALIRDMIDLNFVVSSYPKAKLSSVDIAELTQEANILKILNGIGLDLSKKDIRDMTGRQPPDEDDPSDKLPGAPVKPPGPPGSGADQPTPEQAANTRDASPAALSDMTPAAGVPGEAPFRYTEQWATWLRG